MWSDVTAREFLSRLFDTAVARALPARVLADHLPPAPKGRCVVVGAGKASAAMAAALEQAWPEVALSGTVVTRYEHAVACDRIKIIEASHPVPDDNSLLAADEILETVQGLTEDDLVIALISGGGSALMVSPEQGMALTDKQAINKALLKSGASIHEMNIVRKAFSKVKGGKLLAAAQPAQVVTLVISDVPGDDPGVIASGPTIPDHDIPARARETLNRYGIALSPEVEAVLARDTGTEAKLNHHETRMIATPRMALLAAAEVARADGVEPLILGDALEGEAAEVGTVMAGIATSGQIHGDPSYRLLLSGGETTVTIGPEGAGRGGRNTEFLLSLAVSLGETQGVYAIACDTDGIDGTEDAAGAIITPDTLARGKALGLDARDFLSRHDSYSYFDALGDLVKTGPTLTNVNDFRAILLA